VVPRADLGSKSTEPLTYSGAGVDIDAASDLVRRIQKMNPEIGGFGGLFPIGNDQYLVAGTDGVGTKLKLAFDMDQHSTIGTDLVAMSVNDIITLGAKPLFFLDYFATSKLDVDQAEQVVRGIVEGCKASDCILLGGETAEMPGFYGEGEYDLSGFAVGIVQKKDLIDGKDIAAGDVLVGLPSSGVHSNGYSLVRQVLARSGLGLQDPFPLDPTRTVGEVLLVPTELYARDLLRVADVAKVKGAVHVTGGGFQDNIPRVLPQGLGVQVYRDSWEVLPVFQWMQEVGSIEFEEMYRTFNMGIGFIMVMAEKDAKKALEECPAAKIIGQVVQEQGVAFT
jgi:phosphoribosylformylglycinamidine cyclo-ligase